jgi:hypothetical protein
MLGKMELVSMELFETRWIACQFVSFELSHLYVRHMLLFHDLDLNPFVLHVKELQMWV